MTDVTVQISELIQHSAWVERLARCLVHDPAAADDLVQETWLRAMRSPPVSMSSTRSRRAFLGRVVRNLLRQRAREDRHRAGRETDHAAQEALPATADLVAAVDSHRSIVEEILGLPQAQRDALLLRYFHNLSAAEIARRTGDSPATVRSRLKRGLTELRARLDRKAGGDAEPLLMTLVLAAPPAGLSPLATSGAAPFSLTALLMSKSNVLLAAIIVLAVGVAGAFALRSGSVAPVDDMGAEHVASVAIEDQEALSGPLARGAEEQRLARPADGPATRAGLDSASESAPNEVEAAAKEAPLRGRVLDLQGRPVPGASVWVGRPIAPKEEALELLRTAGPAGLEDPETPDPLSVVLTDDRGRFRIDDIERGTYTVWARRRDTRFAWQAPVEVPSQAPIEIKIEIIPRDQRISGVVQDDRGRPYPEAELTYSAFQESGSAMSSSIPVDDQGRFDIEVQVRAAHDIVANDPHADPARPMRAYANKVEPGTLDLVLRLGEAPILNVQVEEESGIPIEGVRVMPMIGGGGSKVSVGSYPGPHPGGFVELPLPGRSFELYLNAVGFRDHIVGPLDPGSINGAVQVKMERAPTISGTVFQGDAPSLARVSVSIYRLAPP